jgi:hypothetical protein
MKEYRSKIIFASFALLLAAGCNFFKADSISDKEKSDPKENSIRKKLAPGNEFSSGKLKVTFDKNGIAKLFDNNVLTLEEQGTTLLKMQNPTLDFYQENEAKYFIFKYESPQGSLVKTLKLSPKGAWIIWKAKAKENLKGQISVSSPQKALKAPYLCYYPINRTAISELKDIPTKLNYYRTRRPFKPYCIIAGGKGKQKEFQLASETGLWIVKENSKDKSFKFINWQKLTEGKTLDCLLHYIANPEEKYPGKSFDGEAEERGNLPELADIAKDNFTITISRSSKYTFTNKPLTVKMNYRSLDPKDRSVNLAYKIVDMYGKTVKQAACELKNEKKNFASKEIELSLPENGVYRMELSYSNGKIKRKRETVFAVLPEIITTGFKPNSVFGASINVRAYQVENAGQTEYLGLLAERCGIKWDRWWKGLGDSRWASLEKNERKTSWKNLDIAYETAQKHKIMTLGVISTSTRGIYKNPEIPRKMDKLFYDDFDKYIDMYMNEYLIPMVTHFKGKIKYWEFENEPYWRYGETPEKYVKLLKRGYKEIKKIDPEIKVVGTCGPPGSHGYDWYQKTFALGSLKYQDMLSCHLYLWTSRSWVGTGRELKIREWAKRIRKLMKKYGKVLPLWNTETTVTPTLSMYTDKTRHKDFIRYSKKYADRNPKDLIEFSQMYFKIVFMNYLENIKYFFFVWGGGNEYIFRAFEYDMAPMPIVVVQAAMGKYLEGAELIKEIKLADGVQAYLFKKEKTFILVPWGTHFDKKDSADISIPLSKMKVKARSIFDNELKLDGSYSRTSFKVTWMPFYMIVRNSSLIQLEKAFESAKVKINMDTKKDKLSNGKYFAGRKAKPSDWSGFYSLDLKKIANRGFKDEELEDQKGGWSDEGENDMRYLKAGEWLLNGIPFKIIDSAKNNGKSCVVLRNYRRPYFPEKVKIKVGERLAKLHLLHTHTQSAVKEKAAFTYIVNFKDGKKQTFEIESGRNIDNWYQNSKKAPEAKVAWKGPNPIKNEVVIWQTELPIKHENAAQAVVESLEIISKNNNPIPVIIAITGVYSN